MIINGRPTRIKALNMDFEVVWISEHIENGARKFGWTDLNRQVIHISDALPPGKTVDTLLHEMLHVVCWLFDVEDGVKEEEICGRVSTGLLTLWRDNPSVLQWMQNLLLMQQGQQQECLD